jgi:hypothetical protein
LREGAADVSDQYTKGAMAADESTTRAGWIFIQ